MVFLSLVVPFIGTWSVGQLDLELLLLLLLLLVVHSCCCCCCCCRCGCCCCCCCCWLYILVVVVVVAVAVVVVVVVVAVVVVVVMVFQVKLTIFSEILNLLCGKVWPTFTSNRYDLWLGMLLPPSVTVENVGIFIGIPGSRWSLESWGGTCIPWLPNN